MHTLSGRYFLREYSKLEFDKSLEFVKKILKQNDIKVYIVDKNNFSAYNKKLYVIVLGGQEAPEGR